MKKTILILSTLAFIASGCKQATKQQTEDVIYYTSTLRPNELNLQMGEIYTDIFEYAGNFYGDEYSYYKLKLENDSRELLLIRNRVENEPRLNVGDKLEIQWKIDSLWLMGAPGIGEWAVNVTRISSAPANKILEGRYRNSEDTSCSIFLVIDKSDNEYSFTLLINDSEFNGKVTVLETGIVLEGIPWQSNLGELKNGELPEDDKGEPTYGIDFVWDDGNITMQNYGNAMNYYVKLECGDKYITLTKE